MFAITKVQVPAERSLSLPTRYAMTRTLLVAYDLSQSVGCRTQIAELLMTIGEAWARPLDTVWMVRTDLSPEAMEARLTPLLSADDGLMVQEARGDAAFANTGLRWFRPRRQAAMAALDLAAMAAFSEARPDRSEPMQQAA
ncbi:MAG: hypothetical protein AB7L90_01480 [Hyphomicrobiaceae bacterium]